MALSKDLKLEKQMGDIYSTTNFSRGSPNAQHLRESIPKVRPEAHEASN